MRRDTRKTTAKIAASVVLVGAAAAVAGLGTFGSFTSTTSASEKVSSGTVVLNQGAVVYGLSVNADNMVPGDTAERDVTLVRGSASETFGSVTLTTSASPSSILDTDAAKGLQLTVDKCGTPWTLSNKQLTCAGGSTNVVNGKPVIGSYDLGAAMTDLNGAGKTAYLRVKLSLPTAADNSFQGKSSTISFSFDATQRAGQAV